MPSISPTSLNLIHLHELYSLRNNGESKFFELLKPEVQTSNIFNTQFLPNRKKTLPLRPEGRTFSDVEVINTFIRIIKLNTHTHTVQKCRFLKFKPRGTYVYFAVRTDRKSTNPG